MATVRAHGACRSRRNTSRYSSEFGTARSRTPRVRHPEAGARRRGAAGLGDVAGERGTRAAAGSCEVRLRFCRWRRNDLTPAIRGPGLLAWHPPDSAECDVGPSVTRFASAPSDSRYDYYTRLA